MHFSAMQLDPIYISLPHVDVPLLDVRLITCVAQYVHHECIREKCRSWACSLQVKLGRRSWNCACKKPAAARQALLYIEYSYFVYLEPV